MTLKKGLVVAAIAIAALLSVTRLSRQGERLVAGTGPEAGGDLKMRHAATVAALSGVQVYDRAFRDDALDPPATYLILWPLCGWLKWPAVRFLWAALTSLSLVWLALLFAAESGGSRDGSREGKLPSLLALLLVTSGYGVAVSVGLGQLGPLVLPAALSAVLLARRSDGWLADAGAALLFLLGLAKPSFAAAFFWALLFLGRRARPALLAAALYGASSVLVLALQPAGFAVSLRAFWAGLKGHATSFGYGHFQLWLTAAGLSNAVVPASALTLAALGVWVHRKRRSDPWILLGVSAIVARVSVYHRFYDDMLLLVPAVALLRLGRSGTTPAIRRWAALLFGAAFLAQLAPTRIYQSGGAPGLAFQAVQVGLWCVELVFLAAVA